MVKKLEWAAKKWAKRVKGKGAKWKKNVTGKESEYCAHFAEFLGKSPEEIRTLCENYAEGLEYVSAEDWNKAINRAIEENRYLTGLKNVGKE